MLKKGLGVTISLVYHTLGIVAAEEPVVLQRPGVPGANRFHAFGGETLEFLKLAMWILSLDKETPGSAGEAAAV